MGLVTRAMITAGGLLVVLIAGLTWLVTRQVVTPVRHRPSSGRAARGRSPHRAAARDRRGRPGPPGDVRSTRWPRSLQRQIRQLEEPQPRPAPVRLRRARTSCALRSRPSGWPATCCTTPVASSTRRRPGRQSSCRPSSTASRRCWPTCSRSAASTPALPCSSSTDVNLVDVAHRVVEATRPLAEQRDVRIVVHAPDHPCLAEADVRRVERIVRNLVTNAIDHAQPQPLPDGRRDGSRRSSASRLRRAVGGDRRSATTASAWRRGESCDGLQPVLARRPGPGRARAAAPVSACPSRWRTRTCTAAGCRRGARLGEGSQFRLTLPRRAGDVLRQSPLPLVPADAPEPVA